MKKVTSFLLLNWAIFLMGCTTQGTSWDVDGYAPVVETTLDLHKLFGDENMQVNGDSSVYINATIDAFTFNLDTATEFPQFVVPFDFVWIYPSFTVLPNTSIPTQEVPIDLATSLVTLRQIKLSSGKLKLTVKSTATEDLIFTYYVPAATLGGSYISFTDTMRALGVGEDTVLYTREFDVSGYDIDLTGPGQDDANTFSAYVDVTTTDSLAISNGQVVFTILNEMVDIVPAYGKGYLGQYDFSQTNISSRIDEMKMFQSGIVDIEQIDLVLKVINTIGAEARFKPEYFTAVNNRTGVSINLTHPELNVSVNLNRAIETGSPSNPVLPTMHTYYFNGGNSNLDQIVELLPDEIQFSAQMKLNPYGNISGYNDFYYTSFPARVEMNIQAPLKFSISQLMLIDTIDNPFTNLDILDNVIDGEFIVRAENKFPLEFKIQLYSLDDLGVITDSVLVSDIIPAAPVNAMNRVDSPVSADLVASVNSQKLNHLKTATSIKLKARVNSLPVSAGRLQMYIDYYLKIKLIADIKYHIEL